MEHCISFAYSVQWFPSLNECMLLGALYSLFNVNMLVYLGQVYTSLSCRTKVVPNQCNLNNRLNEMFYLLLFGMHSKGQRRSDVYTGPKFSIWFEELNKFCKILWSLFLNASINLSLFRMKYFEMADYSWWS